MERSPDTWSVWDSADFLVQPLHSCRRCRQFAFHNFRNLFYVLHLLDLFRRQLKFERVFNGKHQIKVLRRIPLFYAFGRGFYGNALSAY
jgi:hypothetical protein